MTDRQNRYSAHVWVHHETGKVTLTVRRSVPAGIDGPWGGLDEVTSMDEVHRYLREHGYALAEGWKLSVNHAGLNLDADLIRVDWPTPRVDALLRGMDAEWVRST
jgi:hypothetical protein